MHFTNYVFLSQRILISHYTAVMFLNCGWPRVTEAKAMESKTANKGERLHMFMCVNT
jgi:hypothetical protein